MPMPGLFTPREEQLYEEIVAAMDKHRAEYDRCINLLQPYLNRLNGAVFSAAEEQAYKGLEAQANYHDREWRECQLRLKPYRDWQNVVAYVKEEAHARGFLEGFAEQYAKWPKTGASASKAARVLLKEHVPIRAIAELTGLTKAEIEALPS